MTLRAAEPGDRPALNALGFDDAAIEEADNLLVALDDIHPSGARDLRVMGRGDEDVLILETRGRGEPAATLFGATLGRAVDLVAARGRTRAVLQARCAPEDRAARWLFELFGLAEARRLWTMTWDGTPPVARPALPTGIDVRPYLPGQHDEQWRLAFNDAFADHYGGWMQLSAPAWRRYVAQPGFEPHLSLVAWDGGEIAGFCHCRFDGSGLGQVRYVGVRPRWRRRGLGEALTRLGMRRLREAGADRVTLGVDATNTTGAHLIYQRLGFVVTGHHLMFRRELCTSSTA